MDTSGLRTIFVADFQGAEKLSQAVRLRIIQGIEGVGIFRLVNPPNWDSLLPTGPPNLGREVSTQDIVIAGRRLGVDAVLTARVQDRASSGGKLAVAVDFQIIDVRRGSVRASNTVVHTFTRDPSNKTGTSDEIQRERLANLCADDIAHMLVPHRDTLDVPLETMAMGTGASAMREGNKLARKGQWAAAMEQWQSALKENPDNDGALYNLGLAYEALGDFRTARENFQAALRNSNKSVYSDALVRIDSSTSNHRLAMQQIRQARQSRSALPSVAAIFRDRFDGSSFSRNSTMQSLPQIRSGR